MYDTIDKLQVDLDQLKVKYNESGPIFTGRNEII